MQRNLMEKNKLIKNRDQLYGAAKEKKRVAGLSLWHCELFGISLKSPECKVANGTGGEAVMGQFIALNVDKLS